MTYLVIDLANKLRTDTVLQEPSTDGEAPNMENGTVKQGSEHQNSQKT